MSRPVIRHQPPAPRATDLQLVAAHARLEKAHGGPRKADETVVIREAAELFGVPFDRARDAVFRPLGVR